MRTSPGPVVETWRALAAHAADCRECEVGIAELRQVPDEPAAAWGLLCDTGRALFEAWDEAKRVPRDQVLIRAQECRRRWGLEGLEEPEAQRRIAAIMTVPDAEATRLFALDDEPREAQLRALVSGYRQAIPIPSLPTNLSGPSATPRTNSPQTCEACGGPNPSRGRFCSRACRLSAPTPSEPTHLPEPHRLSLPPRADSPMRPLPDRPSAPALLDTGVSDG